MPMTSWRRKAQGRYYWHKRQNCGCSDGVPLQGKFHNHVYQLILGDHIVVILIEPLEDVAAETHALLMQQGLCQRRV